MACDLAVVGSGPGGYVAAARAAQLGLRTVLVEKEARLGGTCTLRGCIPTKALLHAAELWRLCRKEAAPFGIEPGEARFDWAKVQRRKEAAVTKSSKGIEHLLRGRGVEVVRGHGRLREPGRLEIDGPGGERTLLAAPKVVLAAGSRPAAPPGVEVDGERVLFSDHLLQIGSVPSSLVILGAGAVGCEFADLMSAFGCKVTLVEMLPRILPLEDQDCADVVARALQRRGVRVLTGRRAARIERTAEGVRVELLAADGAGVGGAGAPEAGTTAGTTAGATAETLAAERLLVAVGRRPAADGLGLENAAAERDRRGFVAVDAAQQTAEPGLYAIGDLVPTQQLAHLASREGLVAAGHAAGRPLPPIVYDLVPSCVYTSPEVASVGLTEQEARRRGHAARSGSFPFAALAKASILGEPHGLARVVLDEAEGRVLGVHLAGPRVTELIAGAAAAVGLVQAEAWAGVVHPHPTLSEAVGEALLAALGRPLHGE